MANNKSKETLVITTDLKLSMTYDEAYELLKHKNGKIAKDLRKYMNDILETMAKKCLELKAIKDKQAK